MSAMAQPASPNASAASRRMATAFRKRVVYARVRFGMVESSLGVFKVM
jgi:hypothetical protein